MGTATYTAMTIAKWFIAWAEDAEDTGLSNLKLQKLLYYAQGHHLASRGEPLFRDQLQAWSHGPVVPTVYHAFKDAGSGPITLADDDDFEWTDVDMETAQFLGKVWNTYGGIAAWRLRNMTHDEAPWREHFVDGERGLVIPEESLRMHFVPRTKVS